jgi:hypothetical protein
MKPTFQRPLRARVLTRTGLGLALALALSATAGCSGSKDDPDGPESSSPAAAPSGNPFSATFTGPDTAQAGDTITATVTNTGRLPDVYQLSTSPEGAASFDTQDFHLSPDESQTVQISVQEVPVTIVLKSSGGGGGDEVAELDIAAG